jgi:hypothetical protein
LIVLKKIKALSEISNFVLHAVVVGIAAAAATAAVNMH